MAKAGVKLTREISLKVEWTALAENMSKAVSEGFKVFSGDYKSGIDAAVALLGAAKSINQDIPVGARALELIILCFAWSFDAVRARGYLKEESAKKAAKRAISSLKARVEKESIEIPYDFFENPASAEPYVLLRDEFLKERSAFRPSDNEDEAILRARIDSSFRSAVWEVWADRAPTFEALAQTLKSPSAAASDFDRQWQAYRESLVRDFNVSPLFGQEETGISLGQLYVPLRCFWREIEKSDEENLKYEESENVRHEVKHVRFLQDELGDWIDNGEFGDWLRLVGGGPGSGKSTSAKAFAARVATRDDLRPLFIPLQRLPIEGRLRDNINNYFRNRTGCPFYTGPLERKHVEGGPRLLLIFDGLDEIARPGENADDITRDMVDWIRDLHTEITGETSVLHRILVTGRTPSFQAARRRINRTGHEALEVLGFLPVQIDGPTKAKKIVVSGRTLEGEDELLKADDRPVWWSKYRSALGRPKGLPDSLTDHRLEGLTAEPLLCYLLALSGYLESNAEEAADNRNKIYERLLHDVWRRSWGGGRAGPGKDLSEEGFNRLFEAMALAAWHGGDERVATLEKFENALKLLQAVDLFEEFMRQDGGDVSNLAVNFYLKRPESVARGFEFTHKSFGEYLTARALTKLCIEAAHLSTSRMEVALRDWLNAVSEGELTFELLDFLKDECRLLTTDLATFCLRASEKIVTEVVRIGFPAHDLRCENWRQTEERQRKAEVLMLAMLHCFSERVCSVNEKKARKNVDWNGDKMAFGNMIHRIRKSRNSHVPSMLLLSRIDSPGAYLLAQDFIDADLQGINLAEAWCFRASMMKSRLSGANLRGAHLRQANLIDAVLTGANLRRANLNYALLDQADLETAHLDDAELTLAVLKDANLFEADLRGAELGRANLKRTNLKSANLKGANLEGANLEDANLEGANLEGANLEDANLEGANLEGANVKGANLAGVSLDAVYRKLAITKGAVFDAKHFKRKGRRTSVKKSR